MLNTDELAFLRCNGSFEEQLDDFMLIPVEII